MIKFKRPDNVSFPSVYYNFFAKDKKSDNVVEYRVQDLPEDYYELALDFMVKYFLPDETLCKSKNSTNYPEFVEAFTYFWRTALQHKLSIGCFRNSDKSNELVGVNIFVVKSINDPMNCKNDDANLLDYTMQQLDVYAKYNVDQYLAAYGLSVNNEYRGRGIATEMLKARIPILRSLGLKVTITAFTGIASQIAATKAGYEDVYSKSYAELEKIFPTFDFSKQITKYFKIMALEV